MNKRKQNEVMYPPKMKENKANLTQPIENKEERRKDG